MTSQTGPRGKDDQKMNFGQSIKYNTRNIFLGILYIKWGGEASPRPFYKKSRLSMFLD